MDACLEIDKALAELARETGAEVSDGVLTKGDLSLSIDAERTESTVLLTGRVSRNGDQIALAGPFEAGSQTEAAEVINGLVTLLRRRLRPSSDQLDASR